MAKSDIGTRDLEKGMHSSRAASFVTIAMIATATLLIFDSADLKEWSRHLPPSTVSRCLAKAATGWHRLMEGIGPAKLFDGVNRSFKDVAP